MQHASEALHDHTEDDAMQLIAGMQTRGTANTHSARHKEDPRKYADRDWDLRVIQSAWTNEFQVDRTRGNINSFIRTRNENIKKLPILAKKLEQAKKEHEYGDMTDLSRKIKSLKENNIHCTEQIGIMGPENAFLMTLKGRDEFERKKFFKLYEKFQSRKTDTANSTTPHAANSTTPHDTKTPHATKSTISHATNSTTRIAQHPTPNQTPHHKPHSISYPTLYSTTPPHTAFHTQYNTPFNTTPHTPFHT